MYALNQRKLISFFWQRSILKKSLWKSHSVCISHHNKIFKAIDSISIFYGHCTMEHLEESTGLRNNSMNSLPLTTPKNPLGYETLPRIHHYSVTQHTPGRVQDSAGASSLASQSSEPGGCCAGWQSSHQALWHTGGNSHSHHTRCCTLPALLPSPHLSLRPTLWKYEKYEVLLMASLRNIVECRIFTMVWILCVL